MCNYMPVTDVYAREILDSRGYPAAEIEVMTEDGSVGRAALPCDVCSGRNAETLRDGETHDLEDSNPGVCHFVNSVLSDVIIGENVYEQTAIDRLLCHLSPDGILGVSLALAAAAAKTLNQPLYRYLGGMRAHRLPVPVMSILSGGIQAEKSLDFREIMMMPVHVKCYGQGLRMCAGIYREVGKLLKERGFSCAVAENGGFVPELKDVREALELITEAVQRAGCRPGEDIALTLIAAADDLYDKTSESYVFPGGSAQCGCAARLGTEEMISRLEDLCQSYPVVSVENALAADDRGGWKILTERLGGRIDLVSRRLPDSNRKCLARGIRAEAGNTILIQPCQARTLTELLDVADLAQRNGYRTVFSGGLHETEDALIADLAVAAGASQIRVGAPCCSERAAKYNRLLRIEDSLGLAAAYESIAAF